MAREFRITYDGWEPYSEPGERDAPLGGERLVFHVDAPNVGAGATQLLRLPFTAGELDVTAAYVSHIDLYDGFEARLYHEINFARGDNARPFGTALPDFLAHQLLWQEQNPAGNGMNRSALNKMMSIQNPALDSQFYLRLGNIGQSQTSHALSLTLIPLEFSERKVYGFYEWTGTEP